MILAVELLLFELRPRSLIPVAMATVAATSVRYAFVGTSPVFAMPDVAEPGGGALAFYVALGALLGLVSVGVTRVVYAIEDAFERLPIHWMWWPALGGVVVGLVGWFAPATLGGVHVYFPDPWPKKRHHKRRLLRPDFVHALALRLQPGGYLHVATDWQPYADEILAACAAEPLLANTAAGFAPRPAWRPQTKFESRGLALGHAVSDILFTRTDR